MALDGVNTHSFITVNYNRQAKGLGAQNRNAGINYALFNQINSGPRVQRASFNENIYANSYLNQQYAQYYDMSGNSNGTKFDWAGGVVGGATGAFEGYSSGGWVGAALGFIGGLFSGGSKSA